MNYENRYAAIEREYYLGQATPTTPVAQVTDPTLVPWIVNPTLAAAKESQDLLDALTSVRDESAAAIRDLNFVASDLAARKARLDGIKAQRAGLTRQGLGELAELEHAGVVMDPNSISGLFSGIRKALKSVDKAVIQKATHPVRDFTMKQAPWLRTIDKAAIRPVAKTALRSAAFLDKYVPGWMTVLDVVVPLPGLSTIIGAAAGSAGGGLLSIAGTPLAVVSKAGNLLDAIGIPGNAIVGVAGNTVSIAAQQLQPVISAAKDLASPVTSIVTSPGSPITEFAKSFPLTVAKGTHTYLKTKGSFLQKLQATGLEAMSGFAQVVSIAASVATFGGATAFLTGAIQTLNLSLTALKTGISLIKANEAARLIKSAAKKVREAAQVEAARIAAEEAAYLAEIKKIKDSIEAVRRERERLLALKKQSLSKKAPTPDNTIAVVAEKTGLSEQTVVLGGLAVVAGFVTLIAVVKNRSDD